MLNIVELLGVVYFRKLARDRADLGGQLLLRGAGAFAVHQSAEEALPVVVQRLDALKLTLAHAGVQLFRLPHAVFLPFGGLGEKVLLLLLCGGDYLLCLYG